MRLTKDSGGVVLHTAENGKAALEFLLGTEATGGSTKDGKPLPPTKVDAIMLDNQMPFLTGLQVVAELRRQNRTEFVVGITGNALKEDQEEFEECGADQYVVLTVAFFRCRS